MEFVGIDKFSLLDYDELVSIVLFAPKCNFRCPFCHNGESVLNSNEEIFWEDIYQYLKDRKNVIDAVVFSGGEPTLMPELIDRIKMTKELGYKIKLDSNGSNPHIIKQLIDLKLLDYIAIDIKNSPEKYPLTCGVNSLNMDNMKESISLLKNSNIKYEFRTTLVDEYHDYIDMQEIGKLLNGAEVLYLQKFVDREGVIKKGLHPISEEKAKCFKKYLQNYIKKVELRGY